MRVKLLPVPPSPRKKAAALNAAAFRKIAFDWRRAR
jgi:hypothetical protein